MDEPLAVALKFGFVAVLYLFLLWVSRSALRDLARDRGPATPSPASAPLAPHGEDRVLHAEPCLEVVAALGHEPGTIFDISGGVTLGRGEAVEIRVEDQFASATHARIYPRDGHMHIEDMGSTNGTYLNGRQLRGAAVLRPADVIRIGDSEYRYGE